VFDPQLDLAIDMFPCEDGHAQECSLLNKVLETVMHKDLWIADRNFCTQDFLYGISQYMTKINSLKMLQNTWLLSKKMLQNTWLLSKELTYATNQRAFNNAKSTLQLAQGKNGLFCRDIIELVEKPKRKFNTVGSRIFK
jgi:hypothetical protein